MSQTRKGAEAEVQQKAEQEKINAANARSAALAQMKSKVSNVKLKLSLLMNKMRVNLTDYRDTKDEVGAETERDATVPLIQSNWPKLEAVANQLQETSAASSDAVSKANDTELKGDPSTMINNCREKANEAYTEYMEFKEQNNKEIRDIKKLKLIVRNAEDEIIATGGNQLQKETLPRQLYLTSAS